jgi:hypothetical protein
VDLSGQRLPCGADIDELLDQVADVNGAEWTDHQSRCPHCQAALTELARLWAPVRALAGRPVTTPVGLTATVMRHIRQTCPDVWYTLQLTDHDVIRVAARVVAAVARNAALRVPGVRIARQVQQHVTAELRDRVGLHHVTVNITVDDVLPPSA